MRIHAEPRSASPGVGQRILICWIFAGSCARLAKKKKRGSVPPRADFICRGWTELEKRMNLECLFLWRGAGKSVDLAANQLGHRLNKYRRIGCHGEGNVSCQIENCFGPTLPSCQPLTWTKLQLSLETHLPGFGQIKYVDSIL